MAEVRRFESGSVGHGRAIAFFDAIYGFAITLLVVNIDPPPAQYWTSVSALLDSQLGANLFAFTVSFVVIAVFWWSSHKSLSELRALDPPTIFVAIAAMFFIVLVPFATQGIGDEGTADTPLAVAIYAIVIAGAVLGQIAVSVVARARGLSDPSLTARAFRIRLLDALLTPAVFLLSIPIAYLVSPGIGRWSWASLIVLGPLIGRFTRRAIAREAPATAEPAG